MKVFDLQCDRDHVFEGWFASRDNYDSQQARGLISCPVCASVTITKRLSAPRLNVSNLHEPSPERAGAHPAARNGGGGQPHRGGLSTAKLTELQAAALKQIREMVRSAENVGPRFAEEARRIHEGEAKGRTIRGTATEEERAILSEDGIEVHVVPDFLDESRMQ